MLYSRLLIIFMILIFSSGCETDNGKSGVSSEQGGESTAEDDGRSETKTGKDAGSITEESLSGVDADNNGIRDDVQNAIKSRYPANNRKTNALNQAARSLQLALIAGDSSDHEKLTSAANKIFRAIDCLHETMEDPAAEISFLEISLVNTKQRSEAYINFNGGMSGQNIELKQTAFPCE